ncbi:uncharacterized protein LOC128546118 [Mercenaria mercenaria]|uniref:uncharacterized protein LOC128546118 n=1 Tax=Mercenaria mercenaria TaxID=6596 RepID=UPI00234F63FF|nr:uncharacterized protein LOC128546118 [Mercenaria mercenaria]XP_053397138.1 uncharacterized protein LOC128546118 [Mercenaria mercenaria]XP_053397139.1 uncharacterized protein LOC128546118 [Mercenaria mercenaria]
MGNCQSLQGNIATNWRFVGRDKDLESCMDLLSKNRSVLVFGMKKIGKSRFIEELYKQLLKQCESKKYVWKDFELDNIDSGHTVYSWFIEFLTCINALEEKERFEKTYPSKSIACDSCKNSQQPDRHKCIVRNATNDLIDALGKYKTEIILFLDNIDTIMDSPELRDCFLHFYKQSVKLSKLQTILTSAYKPKLTTKGIASLELKQLDNLAILELLFEMTEERENSSEEEEGRDKTVKYSPELQVFTPENKPYIEAIVGLCDGLPLGAAMAGLLLTEDDGFLTPEDLVEILIRVRLQGLSPDNCPPDERLDIYTEEMKKLMEDVALFFHCLNENMTGSHFNIDEAVAAASAAGDNAATGAMVKHKILKPGLDRSILSIQKLQGKQKLKWHGILRECHATLKATQYIPSDGVGSAKDMILKFMKENAKNAGLDLDEETLCDPACLALAIRRLANQVEPSSPVQANEDCEKGRMSILKEHEVASKMVATTKFDAEQSSVLKVHEEVETHKDVENSLPSGPRKAKELATRYSVSEGSDNSDSDSVSLQFTNIYLRQTEESMMNDGKETSETRSEQTIGDNYSTSPPSYTSRPGSSEARTAPYHNQNAGSVVEELPPSYKSTVSSNHLPSFTTETNKQFVTLDNSASFVMLNIRSPPLPSVSSASYGSQTMKQNTGADIQLMCSRQASYDNQYLRRARSDPTCYHSENNVSKQPVAKPRREIDTSQGDSLKAPPALEYIPTSPEMVMRQSDKTNDICSPLEQAHKDTRMQAPSLQIAELKEPISDMPVETAFVRSGFSTQGPEDISYKKLHCNDLHVSQENFSHVSHTSSVKTDYLYNQAAQTGEILKHQGQLSASRLSINHSVHESNPKRRSPTAVIRPMPKRRSPPNVDKQLPNERSISNAGPSEQSDMI